MHDREDREEVSTYTYNEKDIVMHLGTGEKLLIMQRLPLTKKQDRGFTEKYLVRLPDYGKLIVYNTEIGPLTNKPEANPEA